MLRLIGFEILKTIELHIVSQPVSFNLFIYFSILDDKKKDVNAFSSNAVDHKISPLIFCLQNLLRLMTKGELNINNLHTLRSVLAVTIKTKTITL